MIKFYICPLKVGQQTRLTDMHALHSTIQPFAGFSQMSDFQCGEKMLCKVNVAAWACFHNWTDDVGQRHMQLHHPRAVECEQDCWSDYREGIE